MIKAVTSVNAGGGLPRFPILMAPFPAFGRVVLRWCSGTLFGLVLTSPYTSYDLTVPESGATVRAPGRDSVGTMANGSRAGLPLWQRRRTSRWQVRPGAWRFYGFRLLVKLGST